MTSEGLGEMFEGDSADTYAGKIPLLPKGVQAEGPVCADMGARTPIGASGIFHFFHFPPFPFPKKFYTMVFMMSRYNFRTYSLLVWHGTAMYRCVQPVTTPNFLLWFYIKGAHYQFAPKSELCPDFQSNALLLFLFGKEHRSYFVRWFLSNSQPSPKLGVDFTFPR